jgi:sulfatase modifying factor 1
MILGLVLALAGQASVAQESRRTQSRPESRTNAVPRGAAGWNDVLDKAPDPKIVSSAAHRTAIEKTKLPWRVRDKASGIEMVLIPPGTYTRGASPGPSGDDENPAHQVTISKAFYLGRFEVTNAQFRKFRPSHDSGSYESKSLNGDTQPVVNVTWADAKAFCDAMGVRLPTEGEWEYAARAGTTSTYPWGGDPGGGKGWVNALGPSTKTKFKFEWDSFGFEDGYDVSAPVGTFKANGFGLHDMMGNAWEWCLDYYADSYAQWSSGVTDPQGPAAGQHRVVRGGSWFGGPWYARSSARIKGEPANHGDDIGFRAARTP